MSILYYAKSQDILRLGPCWINSLFVAYIAQALIMISSYA